MRSLRILAGLLGVSTAAVATSLIPHTLLQRAERSDRVALVQVLSQEVVETPGAPFPIKTYTHVAAGADFRGTGPKEFTIVQIGGSVGPKSMEVPGDAKFQVGETAVVFVTCQPAVDRCHLVALGAGKLEVSGEQVFIQDLTTGEWGRRTLTQLQAELAGKKP